MAKATKAEVMQRVEAVLRIRLDGAQFHDIRDYASAPEQNWGVSDSQLKRYVQASDKLLAERQEWNRGRHLARHLAQRQTLYARAVNAADFRTALAVLRDEAELLTLYGGADPPASGDAGGAAAIEGTADVVKLLAGRLRQIDASGLPVAEKSKLTATLADALLRAIGVDVLDKRLEALQGVLMGRKGKDK